jgi:hypothetical protein
LPKCCAPYPRQHQTGQVWCESNCGNSELAAKPTITLVSNAEAMDAEMFHKEDDDYKDGELTKSCFREFNCDGIFIAHSDFSPI